MRFESEQNLIDAALGRLVSLGIEAYEGVPCLSRCIDLVVLLNDDLVAIEFKLKDWKRALDQARDHRLAVDRAYVCLPPRKVSAEMEQAFVEAEVGLLLLCDDEAEEWPFREMVPAPDSDVKWSIAEQWLTEVIHARR
jgi:hypothetical protein